MDLEKIKHYASRAVDSSKFIEKPIIAKVTGVTFEGRQENLAKLDYKTELQLQRDRRNEYDFYAIEVLAKIQGEWLQVGFVPKPMNKKIANTLDQGQKLNATVHLIKGGCVSEYTGETLSYGLDIRISPER